MEPWERCGNAVRQKGWVVCRSVTGIGGLGLLGAAVQLAGCWPKVRLSLRGCSSWACQPLPMLLGLGRGLAWQRRGLWVCMHCRARVQQAKAGRRGSLGSAELAGKPC